jgi:hypothetical protein
MVIFSKAASGSRRRQRRSEPTKAIADEPSTAAHQSACLSTAYPRGSSRPTAMAATIETAKGTATAAVDRTVPKTRCDRQRSAWTIYFSAINRAATLVICLTVARPGDLMLRRASPLAS